MTRQRHVLGLGPRLLRGLLACCVIVLAGPAAAADGADVQVVARATRVLDGSAPQAVALPEIVMAKPGTDALEATYRLAFTAAGGASGQALYLSGAHGHLRVRLNDRLLLDQLADPTLLAAPRGINLLRLFDLPPDMLREGENQLEITLRGRRALSLSRASIGPQPVLRRAYDTKAMWMVYGPALVAAVMVCLGLSVLVMWLRRPVESIYAFFGVAAVLWGLHTAWSVAPRPLLGPRHFAVWWTSTYYLLVVVLTIFCLRFVGYRFERGARLLLASVALVPLLLYGTQAYPISLPLNEWIRLAMVGITLCGLGAVSMRVWQRRTTDHLLLLLAAFVAAVLGLRDWLVFHRQLDNLPVQLTPFAGLPFVLLVAWILIDRFVGNANALAALNRDLEQRVRSKSAELVSALDHMRSARDWAESANRAKSSFLAAASHDLRQPIHALGLYMAALRGRPLELSSREIVQRMDGSVAALESLFNALLDISRMDAGAVVPQPRPIDLAQLLHRLADDMAGEAGERGLRFAARIGRAPGPVTALADPVLLERVLRNLIDNALKYTSEGGVLVTCRARRGPPAVWRVEVWDTGPGIPTAERMRVFDEFYQVGNPERDRRSGLGLGLSIVRRLARLMQLPLALHSRVSQGTRFQLDIPASDQPVVCDPAPRYDGALTGRVVALVEDDVEVRDAMVLLLGSWGCGLLAGADTQELMRQADASGLRPDAMVADLRLRGGEDGLAAIAAARARWGATLPALVVSGDSAPERLRLMQDSGIPWLAKPVQAARLRSWLTAVTRRSEAQTGAEALQG
jgi:signal transduction histidine kinase/CheY-like chemotaxis protein